MRTMLRMMELRGLTNFGKRGGEGGERGGGEGDLGPFVAACLIWEFWSWVEGEVGRWEGAEEEVKWPRDVVGRNNSESERELRLGSFALLHLHLIPLFICFRL